MWVGHLAELSAPPFRLSWIARDRPQRKRLCGTGTWTQCLGTRAPVACGPCGLGGELKQRQFRTQPQWARGHQFPTVGGRVCAHAAFETTWIEEPAAALGWVWWWWGW